MVVHSCLSYSSLSFPEFITYFIWYEHSVMWIYTYDILFYFILFYFIFLIYLSVRWFFFLFVVNFVIHWNETAIWYFKSVCFLQNLVKVSVANVHCPLAHLFNSLTRNKILGGLGAWEGRRTISSESHKTWQVLSECGRWPGLQSLVCIWCQPIS